VTELKTPALDRLLEVLSSPLAAELDRLVQDTRRTLEQEFEGRLQAALHEAQSTAATETEARLAEAVEQAKAGAQRKVGEELELQFKQRLEEALSQAKNEVSSERATLEQEVARWRVFAEAQLELLAATSQADVLSRFLNLTEPFAQDLALYIVKSGGLALWKTRGNTSFPDIISQETRDPDSYFKLIQVRGKTVAAVYAAAPFKPDGLDFLGTLLEREIEMFGLKLRLTPSKPNV
jgi:hypothetical protein